MILITGGSGLLGSSLISLARAQGRNAVGLYYRHRVSMAGVKFLAADLTDEAEIPRIFSEVRPSSVVHCAAATNVDWCQEQPDAANKVNVAATWAVADITSRNNIRLLYISTDSVFDGKSGNYVETDTPGPVNVYAATKLLAEREVIRRNPAAAIARVNFYGWNAEKESLAEWVLKRLSNRLAVPGFSDVLFCPMLVDDLTEILLALLDRDLSGIYHIVGSEAVSKYEFARRVASTFGFDPEQVVATPLAEARLKAPRPQNTSLNTSKICAALGRPMPDVDTGLRRFAKLREAGRGEGMRRETAVNQE